MNGFEIDNKSEAYKHGANMAKGVLKISMDEILRKDGYSDKTIHVSLKFKPFKIDNDKDYKDFFETFEKIGFKVWESPIPNFVYNGTIREDKVHLLFMNFDNLVTIERI